MPLSCLQEMAAAAPWLLQRWECFPALLQQLVNLACTTPPEIPLADQKSGAVSEEAPALQIVAVRTLVALGAHDERARQVYLSKLIPEAMAADTSRDACWQAVLAGCSAVFAAGQGSVRRKEGERAEGFSVNTLLQSMAKRENSACVSTAKGSPLNVARLCKLAQLKVCS